MISLRLKATLITKAEPAQHNCSGRTERRRRGASCRPVWLECHYTGGAQCGGAKEELRRRHHENQPPSLACLTFLAFHSCQSDLASRNVGSSEFDLQIQSEDQR